MNLELDGKVAWVLGGGGGLGRAVARQLANEGAIVWISGRSPETLESAASEIIASGGVCRIAAADVTVPASLDAAHQEITRQDGDVDILVVNGGGPPAGAALEMPLSEVDLGYSLLLRPAWQLSQLVAPAMGARGSGVILFLTSSSTREVIPNLALSNAFRAGVVGLAKTLAHELGPSGVRVLCVAPGRIATARVQQLDEGRARRAGTTVDEVQEQTRGVVALRRYGEADEFGSVVAMLASVRSSYLTGVTVSVDGGLLRSIHA